VDDNAVTADPGERGFKVILDRVAARLALPAEERAPVVGDGEFQAHGESGELSQITRIHADYFLSE
jgi:hypothetical protein